LCSSQPSYFSFGNRRVRHAVQQLAAATFEADVERALTPLFS
jgi:hypothetical protein